MDIKIGDKVRSFDFAMGDMGRDLEGNRASYVEGEVINIAPAPGCPCGSDHFHIRVIREFLGGEEGTRGIDGETVFPPVVMGIFDDVPNVEKIS